MQMVATLGAFRLKSAEFEVKFTMRHSISGSSTESDTMEMEIHSEVLVSDIVNDPLCSS